MNGIFEICNTFLPANFPVFGFLQNELLPTYQIPHSQSESKSYCVLILSELFKKIKPKEEFFQSLKENLVVSNTETTNTIDALIEFGYYFLFN